MPVPGYGVLKGRAKSGKIQGPHGRPPHFHIMLDASGQQFDIAVNVLSTDGSEVLYYVNHAFTPPQADGLVQLPQGRTILNRTNPLALDFQRQNLVRRDQMGQLSARDAEHLTESDLHNEIDDLVVRAIGDPKAQFFAFGSEFPDGIHDIHMNQGNPRGDFFSDNGIFQDGALLVFFPNDKRWLAAFIAFQSQSWNTDNQGNPK